MVALPFLTLLPVLFFHVHVDAGVDVGNHEIDGVFFRTLSRTRYQTLPLEVAKSMLVSAAEVFKRYHTQLLNARMSMSTFGTLLVAGDCKIVGVGPFFALDFARSLQYRGFLLAADDLTGPLGKGLGAYKTVHEHWTTVTGDGAMTTVQTESILCCLRCLYPVFARQLWRTRLKALCGGDKLKESCVRAIFFPSRTHTSATCITVEMLLCESRKGSRPNPRQYFNVRAASDEKWKSMFKKRFGLTSLNQNIPLVVNDGSGKLRITLNNFTQEKLGEKDWSGLDVSQAHLEWWGK